MMASTSPGCPATAPESPGPSAEECAALTVSAPAVMSSSTSAKTCSPLPVCRASVTCWRPAAPSGKEYCTCNTSAASTCLQVRSQAEGAVQMVAMPQPQPCCLNHVVAKTSYAHWQQVSASKPCPPECTDAIFKPLDIMPRLTE